MGTDALQIDLPNRFDHRAAQPRIYGRWEEKNYFHSEPDPARKPFTIVIPPPNVTGALHLGHALNNTLQDVLIRMKRMQGFNALWIPGTDHAGIATQAVVERRIFEEEKLSRHDLGREKLVARIWDWKAEYEQRILNQLKRLGCSCDWQRTRFTLDPVCARAVRHTFFDLFRKHLLFCGKRLVNWDTFLQTAVSDDEVFHETVKGNFWHFRYPVVDPLPGEPTHVTIATTRPETMLGDTAVAVHPDPRGALDELEKELRAKLAAAPVKERPEIEADLEHVLKRRETHLERLEKLRDMALDGRMLMLPLLEREIPLVVDPWAKPELGSGCVKITPAHDANDYEVGLRRNLPMINILNPDGTLNANAGTYKGLTIEVARRRVVTDLNHRNLVEEIEDREIELAHSDRSKTPIEPYLADQWFVRMEQLAQNAMDAVTDGRVEILPTRYAKGYLDWLAEKRDWPVSRQLWWGHQIPIWTLSCKTQKQTEQLTDRLEKLPAVAAEIAAYQVQLDPERQAAERHGGTVYGAEKVRLPYGRIHVCLVEDDEAAIAELEGLGFVREQDVLDTWFSSALWPHSTLGWPEQTPELAYYYPTSTLITSRDIISLWVARMVLAGLNNMNEVPFHQVFIHPKILDGYGESMSKTKGNGVDPIDVLEKFGSDALRFGLAYLTTDTQDVRMPVQFECPHCEALIEQTKKNRQLPRVECKKCGGWFSTQWAVKDEDRALPRGAVVSERFELARNFGNKLWNASRFALMNLEGFQWRPVADDELLMEDRWILSRLATVTDQVTDNLENYHYADAARAIYDFAWDEFCSFYVEMVKGRLADPAQRGVAQRVLAFVLDNLLRLLHPMMPFITEEVWQLFARFAPGRDWNDSAPAAESVMIAPWPTADRAREDETVETQFKRFQEVLGAIREMRSRHSIAPRETIRFRVKCDAASSALLQQMEPYFVALAGAEADGFGPDVTPPATHAMAGLNNGIEVFVDMERFIDIDAEIAKIEKELQNVEKTSQGKAKKLENEQFVSRAPADVVQRERESLEQLVQQKASLEAALVELRKKQSA